MTVIVGYIPTPEGATALAVAADEARLRQRPLVIVNVHRDDRLSDSRVVEEDDAVLTTLVGEISARGVPVSVEVVHEMEAPEAIVDQAQRHRADVVVIGIRRRSAVGKLLMGSTALSVIMSAPCPVITVRDDATSHRQSSGT